MDLTAVDRSVADTWREHILPSLTDFITIPALSPTFDPQWSDSGHIEAATEHVRAWLTGRDLPGATVEVVRLPELTPVLLMDIPATEGCEDAGTVLLYGHLDKQPPMGGWSEGLGPWSPVQRDGLLYGRGVCDDGYAGYAATAAIEAVRSAGGRHARCVVLLENSEESGSPHLPPYLEHLRDRLGAVSLVVCLDSGGYDYDRLWLTTSLRGLVSADVTVQVMDGGLHSGMASGVVPSSFRVFRQLLDRVEDAVSGEVLLPQMHADIPDDRMVEAKTLVEGLGDSVLAMFPVIEGMHLASEDPLELTLNSTWRPTLSVIGVDGMPPSAEAGNVLRPFTTLSLSFRLPPTADSAAAEEAMRTALTTDVPYGAKVTISRMESADGLNTPTAAPWLHAALDNLTGTVFDQHWRAVGLGGSIPFMAMLAAAYPQAQFVITGAAGPDTNAHVPDESLNLDFAAKVTKAVAQLVNAHACAG